jgi:hypothetical protein
MALRATIKSVFPLMLMYLLLSLQSKAQGILDYKTKNASNEKDRTMILDVLRASLYQSHRQEFIFVVKKLNVTSTHAWFEGEAQRKDGKKVISSEFDDCCHVEALLKRSSGKWYIMEMGAFSTDVWWDNIWVRYKLPKRLFGF